MLIPRFAAEYPGAIVVPCNITNAIDARWINTPKVLVLHTPEEPADDIEVTPYYFQKENLRASTTYYLDNDGDWYQMVPEKQGAIANGVINKPYPEGTNPLRTLNLQSLSVEIEGYARNMDVTMPRGSVQWNELVKWVRVKTQQYNIPLIRSRVIGHYEVSNRRTDPGKVNIDHVIEDAREGGDEVPTQQEWNKHQFSLAVYAQLDKVVAQIKVSEFDNTIRFNAQDVSLWKGLLTKLENAQR